MGTQEQSQSSFGTGWFTAGGILLILLGAFAILMPAVASLGITIFIGWILIAASVFLFASAFTYRDGWWLFTRLLWAALALIAGLFILINPDKSTSALTL